MPPIAPAAIFHPFERSNVAPLAVVFRCGTVTVFGYLATSGIRQIRIDGINPSWRKIVLSVGSILGGKFQLQRLAGAGGMGEVFEARYLDSGQRVAIKVLRAAQADQLVRFEREARLLAEFDHPNIVRYIEHAVTPLGHPYLVMEWLDGEDLASRLRA